MVSHLKNANGKTNDRPHAEIVNELYDEFMARGIEPPAAVYVAASTTEELENMIGNVRAAKPGKTLVYGDFKPEKVGTSSNYDEHVIAVLSENMGNKKFGQAYKAQLMQALKK